MSEIIPQQRAGHTHLQQIIAGLTDGVILLDPDQTIVWANDAALAMHGVTAREELGADIAEYRARFLLRFQNHHDVEAGRYPMDRVAAGEVFDGLTVEVTRTGDTEQRWIHEVRGLVLTDADGQPDCLALVIHDVTERVSAEERFERAFGTNPAPAIICRLKDLRFIKVNAGFLQMTGYAREALLGRSVYEIDVLERAQQKDFAIEKLNAGRTIPQMEASLRLPDGSSKFVIVAGQPIDIGEEPCMLFTFIDLDLRKKAEDALRQSEERFAKAFKLSPLPTIVSKREGSRIIDVNQAFSTVTGYAAEDVVGRAPGEFHLWNGTPDRNLLEKQLEKSGRVRNLEVQLRTKEGELIDYLVSADTITIDGEACVLSVLQDFAERKRSEAELVAAIDAVMQDASWFSRTVIEKLATVRRPRASGQPTAELADLTARENDVLGLMCQGLSDDAIATKLKISRNTVRNHVVMIYRKIDVHSRSAAIVWARDRGFTGDGSHSLAVKRRKSPSGRGR